jgi:hypothetical protein
MADKPETAQVPVTSERKDPKRVEAGKQLAAISRMAKERKKKSAEEGGSGLSNTTLALAGLVVAVVTLVITYRMNRREEKALEPKWVPPTVTIEKQPDASNIDTLE